MGHIQKRTYTSKRTGKTTTSWQARYTAPDGRERTKRFERKVDAEKWVSANSADVVRGSWVDPNLGKVTFSTYATRWLEERPDLRARTRQLYRSLLDLHLLPRFGSTPIGSVKPSTVSGWHATLVAASPGTAAASYRLPRAIFAAAVRDELLVRSPCRVRQGGADRAVERPLLSVAEVEALTAAMPPGLRAAVVLASWGCLRRGEVLALRRRHVDELRGRVRVEESQTELDSGKVTFGPPKTEAGVRTVHLPEPAMVAVVGHLAERVGSSPDSLLFTGRGGVPLRPRTLATAFRAARAKCGLPGVHFHDLRHFGLTMAATTGASTKELMRRAGHASPAAALRYQHASDDRDAAIARALAEFVQPADVVEL